MNAAAMSKIEQPSRALSTSKRSHLKPQLRHSCIVTRLRWTHFDRVTERLASRQIRQASGLCSPDSAVTTSFINQHRVPCRIDQHERLKSSLRATGLVWRQENHADKLREGRDELNEDEGEKRPEAIPDRKVDRLERHRHCHNES